MPPLQSLPRGAKANEVIFRNGFEAPPPPVIVEGLIEFHGCAPALPDLTVRLTGLSAVAVDSGAGSPFLPSDPPIDPPAAAALDATLALLGDGRVRYQVTDVALGGLYRLEVLVANEDCGELHWRGPRDGLLVAGIEPRPLEGLAVRTQLEIATGSLLLPQWRRAAFVTNTKPRRAFRVRTATPGVESVELQVSMSRFEVNSLSDGSFCNPPEEAVPSVPLVVRSGTQWWGAEIDLEPLITKPPDGATQEQQIRWRRILAGAPIYIRAVPIDGAGLQCALARAAASNWVTVIYQPPRRFTIDPFSAALDTQGTYFAGWYPRGEPVSHNAKCYRVIHDHRLPSGNPLGAEFFTDPLGTVLVIANVYPPHGLATVGQNFCLFPSSGGGGGPLDGIVETFEDVISDAVDAVEWAVNQAAATYNAIKQAAIRYVANAIADLTGCGNPCAAAVALATELALTSMGLPPSLPDFDALMDQGFDYLVAEIATQAGVPPFVAEKSFEIASDIVAQAHATRGLSYADWLVEDTGGRSTLLTLQVGRLSPLVEPQPQLWILPGPPSPVWHSRLIDIAVPAFGQGSLTVPVVLQPDFNGLAPLEPLIDFGPPWGEFFGGPQRAEAWYQTRWAERLGTVPCVHMEFWGSFSTNSGPIPVLPVQLDAAFNMVNAQDRWLPLLFGNECVP